MVISGAAPDHRQQESSIQGRIQRKLRLNASDQKRMFLKERFYRGQWYSLGRVLNLPLERSARIADEAARNHLISLTLSAGLRPAARYSSRPDRV